MVAGDERKPVCERCETANVQCAGYEEPRVVISNKVRKSSSGSPAGPSSSGSPPSRLPETNDLSSLKPQFPLIAFPNNPAEYQIPHQRAREVLGHQQFTARTVSLLFRQNHLYFWRDQLMQSAWDTEYVYDAIIAIGSMHRAILLLSKPNDQFRGTDVKIVALEYYARTLRQIMDLYGHDYNKTSETLVAVLLLLTYFECFSGCIPGALRHLCIAQQHLSTLEALHAFDGTSLPNRDALVTCANDLALSARVVLPLAPITLSLSIDMIVPKVEFGGAENADEEFQQLVALLRTDTLIRKACWHPYGEAEASLSIQDLVAFQQAMHRWKSSTAYTFEGSTEAYDAAATMSMAPVANNWRLPPPERRFTNIKSALAAALFNCYMGRTMWMRRQAGDAEAEDCARQAESYAYENLCIVEGLWVENDQRPLEQRIYLPYERVQIGLTPLMYMGTHFGRRSELIAWSKCKLRSIAEEGFYKCSALASALDLSTQIEVLSSNTPLITDEALSDPSTALIIIPDTQGRCFVVYLMKCLRWTPNVHDMVVRIIGNARWDITTPSGPSEAEFLLFDADHKLNKDVMTRCPYKRLASYEPFAQDWEALLAKPTYSPAAYLPDDFDLSLILNNPVYGADSSLDPIA